MRRTMDTITTVRQQNTMNFLFVSCWYSFVPTRF